MMMVSLSTACRMQVLSQAMKLLMKLLVRMGMEARVQARPWNGRLTTLAVITD